MPRSPVRLTSSRSSRVCARYPYSDPSDETVNASCTSTAACAAPYPDLSAALHIHYILPLCRRPIGARSSVFAWRLPASGRSSYVDAWRLYAHVWGCMRRCVCRVCRVAVRRVPWWQAADKRRAMRWVPGSARRRRATVAWICQRLLMDLWRGVRGQEAILLVRVRSMRMR